MGRVVLRAPLTGGVPITIAQATGPFDIALDATSVSFTDEVGHSVVKVTPK